MDELSLTEVLIGLISALTGGGLAVGAGALRRQTPEQYERAIRRETKLEIAADSLLERTAELAEQVGANAREINKLDRRVGMLEAKSAE